MAGISRLLLAMLPLRRIIQYAGCSSCEKKSLGSKSDVAAKQQQKVVVWWWWWCEKFEVLRVKVDFSAPEFGCVA
jgi:hypothetical protein